MENEQKPLSYPQTALVLAKKLQYTPPPRPVRAVVLRRKAVARLLTADLSLRQPRLTSKKHFRRPREARRGGASVRRAEGRRRPRPPLARPLYANTRLTFAPVPMATGRFVRGCGALPAEPPARRDMARLLPGGRWAGRRPPRLGGGGIRTGRGAPARAAPAPPRAMTHKCSSRA